MRGQVMELIIVFVILFIGFVGLLIGSEVYDKIVDSGKWPTTTVGNSTKVATESTFDVLDYGLVFLAVGLIATIVIAAFFINVHPIFFIVSIVVLAIVVMVSAPLSNAFMGFATSDAVSSHADEYSAATHAVGAIPIFAVVGGILIIIALYAKPGGRGV